LSEGGTYRRECGYSPRAMSVILDEFTRHAEDIAGLSLAMRARARVIARTKQDALDLALLCAAIQRLSDRIVSDTTKARIEISRLKPAENHAISSVCLCGKTIEDGSCRTAGHCWRGIHANVTA
jgi:hypothetical protein